ncbi:portal protein [Microbacterium phage Fede]|nr:portal protein [Microbacterium phage Fede]
MKSEFESVTEFADWYTNTRLSHKGELVPSGFAPCARRRVHQYRNYKSEMDARVKDYWKYEKQAAAEVVSEKADLPNISSGENAGFIRRIARNVVQHTPNTYIANQFDDASVPGILARHMLKTKIIGDDQYSNNMQQNLITTFRRGAYLGFDCVIPVLQQDALGGWYMQYDTIYYRDVFPEPGAKDIRRAQDVYVRRYLTKAEVHRLIKDQVDGWDHAALKTLMGTQPVMRERVDHESKKHSYNPEAYAIITWYSADGSHFLTFAESSNLLLRIEKNKHPLKEHPVFFFVPEKDDQQAYGKSMISLTFGRQEFQDLFMNGAMKMFYRNINPPIIGIAAGNAVPNLSPGKYTSISNPNAKIEALEINTQALMMFGQVSQQNQANMTQMIGAADQQMAAQSTGGLMSQTPQGVEAQQSMVDITTNNYQKAMEEFFSRYCSYALTIFFQELKGTKSVTPTADVRKQLIDEGIPAEEFLHESRKVEDPETGETKTIPADDTGLKDGALKINFADLAVVYYVQCVQGSLVELEDEKQMRILREIFVPLSQALPAMAQAGDQDGFRSASKAMQYIIKKTIEMSGSIHSNELTAIFDGKGEEAQQTEDRMKALEDAIGNANNTYVEDSDTQLSVLEQMQQTIAGLTATVGALAGAMGVPVAGGPGGQTDPQAAPQGASAAPPPAPVPA